MHSVFRVLKKVSAQALSWGVPGRLMLWMPPISYTAARKSAEVYWQPRSVCMTRFLPGLRFSIAVFKAAIARFLSIVAPVAQPTTRLLKRSMNAQTYSQPSSVGTYVKSDTQLKFGRATPKSCFSKFGKGVAFGSETVVDIPCLCLTGHNPRLAINLRTCFLLTQSPSLRSS